MVFCFSQFLGPFTVCACVELWAGLLQIPIAWESLQRLSFAQSCRTFPEKIKSDADTNIRLFMTAALEFTVRYQAIWSDCSCGISNKQCERRQFAIGQPKETRRGEKQCAL